MPVEAVFLHSWNGSTKKWETFDPGYLDTVAALPSDITILTWHVSCTKEYPNARMLSTIDFIKSCRTQPQIIFFQETHTHAHHALLGSDYIQKTYYITPVDDKNFDRPGGSSLGSGLVVMIHRSLRHLNCLYLSFDNSQMRRGAIMVDFKHPQGNYARFIGAHLESGGTDDAKTRRTSQLATLAEQSNDSTLRSTVICGEMAAESVGAPGGFGDVFVNVGGVAARGATWGMYQKPNPVTEERRTKIFVKGSVGTTDSSNCNRVGGGERAKLTLQGGVVEEIPLSESLGVCVKLHLG